MAGVNTSNAGDRRTLQEAAIAFVVEHINGLDGPSEYSKRYRIEHCERVARIGVKVARAAGLDELKLEVACLLHDVGKWDAAKPVDHGRAGALLASDFLSEVGPEFGLSAEDVTEIAQGIAMHTDGEWHPRTDDQGTDANAAGRPYLRFDSEQSILARSVGDCDNVDRFSVYRIADTLRYWDFMNLPRAEQAERIRDYLQQLEANRGYVCATDACQQLWTEALDFQQDFFTRLAAEVG